jgi:hypothetical protein
LLGGDYGTYTNPAGSTVNVANRPPRNWIEAAYKEKPFLPFFVRRWRELAGGGKA